MADSHRISFFLILLVLSLAACNAPPLSELDPAEVTVEAGPAGGEPGFDVWDEQLKGVFYSKSPNYQLMKPSVGQMKKFIFETGSVRVAARVFEMSFLMQGGEMKIAWKHLETGAADSKAVKPRSQAEGERGAAAMAGQTEPKAGAEKDMKTRLTELKESRDAGLITEEEYQAKKTEILAEH
jgi:hypothetical protein